MFNIMSKIKSFKIVIKRFHGLLKKRTISWCVGIHFCFKIKFPLHLFTKNDLSIKIVPEDSICFKSVGPARQPWVVPARGECQLPV